MTKNYIDRFPDLQRDMFPPMFRSAIGSLILWFAAQPGAAIICIIDYLKFPPQNVVFVYAGIMPFLVSVVVARIIVSGWERFLFPLAIVFTTIGLTFIILVARLLSVFLSPLPKSLVHKIRQGLTSSISWSKKTIDKLVSYNEDLNTLPDEVSEAKTKRLFVSIMVFLTSCLYTTYFWDNPISKAWLPKENSELNIYANLHYYCHVTAEYNEDQCEYWKARRSHK
jgi:hypothetical protein